MRILLTGAQGMLGKHLKNHIDFNKYEWLLPAKNELDLLNFDNVNKYLKETKPNFIIHAAAHTGGILANSKNNDEFLFVNFNIGRNIISAAIENKITNFVNVNCSCLYPQDTKIPFKESSNLSENFEQTSYGYSLAKYKTLQLTKEASTNVYKYKNFTACNLYGPYDKFDIENSHMISSAIQKIHFAKEKNYEKVEIWGDGKNKREYMYVADFADFIMFALKEFNSIPQNINIGLGYEMTVDEYYEKISKIIGYNGSFTHIKEKPSGIKSKLMDNKLQLSLGWSAETTVEKGIQHTYNYFLENISNYV